MASGEGCLRLVVARPASALSLGRWVGAVTRPRVSAAAGQPTPDTSATSVPRGTRRNLVCGKIWYAEKFFMQINFVGGEIWYAAKFVMRINLVCGEIWYAEKFGMQRNLVYGEI